MQPGKLLTAEPEKTPRRDFFAQRFLTPSGRAHLLQSRQDAAPQTGDSLALCIAGLGMELRGLAAAQVDRLRAGLADLIGPIESALPTWLIECTPAPESWFHTSSEASAGEAFWEYFLDLEPQADHVRFAGLDVYARLYRSPHRRLEAWLPISLSGGRLEQALHNLLRVATAFAVTDAGGLLLHSSALVAETSGRAVVCPGRSGAGKSTLSGRAQDLGWQVLSDELNVLWLEDHGNPAERETAPRVEQVPFTGDLGRLHRRPGRFPVAAVLPLVRTGRDERPILSPADFYARVLAEAVFANADPETAPRLEANVLRLVHWAAEQGRLESLSFTPDGRLDALWPLFAPVEPRLAVAS